MSARRSAEPCAAIVRPYGRARGGVRPAGPRGAASRRLVRLAVLPACVLACLGAALAALPTASADSPRPRIDMSKGLDAGAPPTVGPDKIARIPPDPTAMVEKVQWVFDLKWDKGDVYLLGMHRLELPAPQATPRAMGRFALELFEGPTLIERVRFDFPLLGAGELPARGDAGFMAPVTFEKKLTTRIGVMFPATARGTRLELWDRATNVRWSLPWPPQETRPTAAGDAGGG